MTIRGFFFTAAALIGVAAASSASAGDGAYDEAPPTMRVSYADLNLSDGAGAKELTTRLHHAAGEVCGRWTTPADLGAQAVMSRCIRDAVAGAMAQVSAQQLAAGPTGRRPLLIAQANAPTR